jgi:hypothetical protein
MRAKATGTAHRLFAAIVPSPSRPAKKKRLEIDPVETETVREVFDLCRAGRGIRAIADHLASGLG